MTIDPIRLSESDPDHETDSQATAYRKINESMIDVDAQLTAFGGAGVGDPMQLIQIGVDEPDTETDDRASAFLKTNENFANLDARVTALGSAGDAMQLIRLGVAQPDAESDDHATAYRKINENIAALVVRVGGIVLGITDSFNRPNNALSLGDTDTGETWQYFGGGFLGIDNNEAYSPPGDQQRFFPYVVTPWSDCIISVVLVTLANSGICFRAVDNGNLFIAMREAAAFQVYRKQADGFNLIAIGGTPVAGDKLSVAISGNSITILQNDVPILGPITDAFQQTAVRHGLCENAGEGRFDNFSVVAA